MNPFGFIGLSPYAMAPIHHHAMPQMFDHFSLDPQLRGRQRELVNRLALSERLHSEQQSHLMQLELLYEQLVREGAPACGLNLTPGSQPASGELPQRSAVSQLPVSQRSDQTTLEQKFTQSVSSKTSVPSEIKAESSRSSSKAEPAMFTFTSSQKRILDSEYSANQNPTSMEMLEIADEIGVDEKEVERWFEWKKSLEPASEPQHFPGFPYFSESQLDLLKKERKKNSKPDRTKLLKLATFLDVPLQQVDYWFCEAWKSAEPQTAPKSGEKSVAADLDKNLVEITEVHGKPEKPRKRKKPGPISRRSSQGSAESRVNLPVVRLNLPQHFALLHELAGDAMLTDSRRTELSEDFGLPGQSVQSWFENHVKVTRVLW